MSELVKIYKNQSIELTRPGKVEVFSGIHTNVMLKGNGEYLIVLHKNSRAHVICFAKNRARLEQAVVIELAGQGSEVMVSMLGHGKGADKHTFDVMLRHQAKNTKGDILIRGVYEGDSLARFTGLIKIEPNAQQTNSYFQNHVLLLDRAMATSVPTLEISANDVKASHDSTTSRLDEQQLFYLRSRGLDLPAARQLIIRGFFQPVISRLPAPQQKQLGH